MLVKDFGPQVQSKQFHKIQANRRTIQCDNAIKRIGLKILVANTELESLSLQAWQEGSSHLHSSYKVMTFRPHLCSEAILNSRDWGGGVAGTLLPPTDLRVLRAVKTLGGRELRPGLNLVLPFRSKSKKTSRRETTT